MNIVSDTIEKNLDRQMIRFSVIIPAYNAEKTIGRCLESLVASSYESIEIIVVDDGSTDNTAEIVEKFVKSDKRIVRIFQSNEGPSVARNNGLEHASGDVITFVDSDDYVELNYFYELSAAFSESKVKVVFFEFNRVDETNSLISSHHLPRELQPNEYYKNLIQLSREDMFGYTWIKAFRRTVLEKIRFETNMCLFEDEVFTCVALHNPLQIKFIYKTLYNYVCAGDTSLARRTHKNYHILCDKVYLAWKSLLRDCSYGYDDFLKEKATHLQMVCKFYGLERDVQMVHFFKELSNCSFVKDHSTEDRLIHAIKNKRWFFVYNTVVVYRIKNLLLKIFK